MNREVLSLGEGDVTLHWPAHLSARSYRHLRAWLVGMIADKLEEASRQNDGDALASPLRFERRFNRSRRLASAPAIAKPSKRTLPAS
jgi:hypothetical protein